MPAQRPEVQVDWLPSELVGLASGQEMNAPPAVSDAMLNEQRQECLSRREVLPFGVVARDPIVESAVIVETEMPRDG